MKMSEIAVIVPVHNRKEITLKFLNQITKIHEDNLRLDTIIIDDGSTDGTSEAISKQYPNVTLLKGDGNLWWTGAIKLGIEHALQRNYPAVLIMNDDVEMDQNFLHEMLVVSREHPLALINSVILNKNKDGQEVIITAGYKTKGWLEDFYAQFADEHYRELNLPDSIECELLSGASLLIPTVVFKTIGNFDDAKFPHGFGDLEFTLRASKAGYHCLTATKSLVYTEQNQNYPNRYLIHSTRLSFIKNILGGRKSKYGYGIIGLYQLSYMHRSRLTGTIYFARRLLGLGRKLLMKLILPNNILRKIINEKNLVENN